MSTELYLDRVPPQNIEAEQSVLGAVLLDSESLTIVNEIISADDFYRTAHQRIFDAMVDLAEEGEPVDLVTLTSRLQMRNLLEEVGGVTYLTQLANAVPTAANVEYYARIVEENSLL